MSILDALQEYDRKVESMIQNLRNDRDLLAKENLQLHSQLSKTTALLSRRTLGIGLLLAKLQKTMSVEEIDELTMGNLDLTPRVGAADQSQIGQLYRRKQGKNFWSDNQDGGLPQGSDASYDDPFVFTIEPSGKLLKARLQRSRFGPASHGGTRLADTYFVWPQDIEVVS